MSKYSVGQKFIIEIKHGIVDTVYGARYFIKGFNTLAFDDNGLDRLERYDADAKANADYNSDYEDGLRDAWECAKIIANLNAGEQFARFGMCFTAKILDKFSASEAKNRIVEYEAKQAEIKIGDEVKIDNDSIGVVTSIWDDRVSGVITVGGEEGKQGYVFNLIDKSRYVKTGRHYDIESILEQLKGADDE